ncbi:hypothetical protein KKF91_14430 [Myxococcota bacterium]|nr:hypothetical protein [Myxococcota bacterium]MBU1431738.1 hypothetical protein [Myxococcota bacterium]MBU1900372.1 hypothetical protein [Myxococcota bacterium]
MKTPPQISRRARRRRLGRLGGLAVTALLCLSAAHAEPKTTVYLNGTPTPVFFNDGDSFRILEGQLAQSGTRLSGFNTLESFGPVHAWGQWTEKELKVIGKQATLNARRGVWRCFSDMNKDTYGRTLWWCPDLAEDQIRKGLAHVMTITQWPGDSRLIEAQREAIAAKRGMWALGVPEFVLTSTHSKAEDPSMPVHYNRLVSVVDGHSHPWPHQNEYKECEKVCWKSTKEEREARLIDRFWLQPQVIAYRKLYDDANIQAILDAFRAGSKLEVVEGGLRDEQHRYDFEKTLKKMKRDGWFDAAASDLEVCQIYTDFRRRFGMNKAACL